MLIPLNDLNSVFEVHPLGVLHVGAHDAEESEKYSALGWGPVIWVDMLPEKCVALEKRFSGDKNNRVIQAACWDTDGEKLPIFRAENGQSSSLLAPEHHLKAHPEILFSDGGHVTTSRLDTILPSDARFDFINFDTQGAELRALKGLGKHLTSVKWAYVEVNTLRLYKDCALLSELDEFFSRSKFKRIATKMYAKAGWGDALYVNTQNMSFKDILFLKLKSFAYFSRERKNKTIAKLSRAIQNWRD